MAGKAEAKLSTLLFHLVSLESVKKGQNNSIERGEHKRLKSKICGVLTRRLYSKWPTKVVQ
jgi:hypothetical protein